MRQYKMTAPAARDPMAQNRDVGPEVGSGLALFAGTETMPARPGHLHSLITQDDISFGCVLDAPWQVTQLGRRADLQPGDGVLLSNAHLGGLTLPPSSRCVAFGMPRTALAPRVPDLGALFARRIPAACPALQLLLRYLELGQDHRIAADPDLQAAFSQHVYDLLALTLAATRNAAEPGERHGLTAIRLRQMQDDIRRSCRQPDLSIHAVAARQSVSARYAQRMFEAIGSTFTEYLTEQRLLAAHQTLRHSRAVRVSVSSIAYDCGFSDISHFNRLFRQRFGCTPTDVRKATFRAD